MTNESGDNYYSRANSPIGDITLLRRLIITPHVFIFIFLSALFGNVTNLLTLNAVVLLYLIVFYIFVDSFVKVLTPGIIIFYLVFLLALLCVGSAMLELNPLLAIYLPFSLSLLCFVLVPLEWRMFIFLGTFGAGVLTLHTVITLFGLRAITPQRLTGSLLMVASMILVGLRSYLGRSDRLTVADSDRFLGHSNVTERDAPSEQLEEQRELEVIFEASRKNFARELVFAYAWRLALLAVIVASLVLAGGYLSAMREKAFAILWILLAVIQVMLQIELLRSEEREAPEFFAYLSMLAIICWWGMFHLFSIAPDMLIDASLAGIIVYAGMLPWSWRFNISLAALFCVLVLLRIPVVEHVAYAVAIASILIFVSLRNSAISHLKLLTVSGAAALSQISNLALPSVRLVKILSWYLRAACDVERAVIIYSDGSSELITADSIESTPVDQVFGRGILQKSDNAGVNESCIAFKDLGDQFLGAFADWFGYVPSRIFVCRLTAMIDAREERIGIVVPMNFGLKLAGSRYATQAISALSAAMRIALLESRSRYLSSDVLLATQNTLNEREHELNELIHHINNIAQDISIHCDNARLKLDSVSSTKNVSGCIDQAKNEIIQLENAARNLSAGASDIKLVRELLKLNKPDRFGKAQVREVFEEVSAFALYRADRHGFKCTTQCGVDDDTLAVEVVSPEYLETALRLLVRVLSRPAGKNSEMTIRVDLKDDFVNFKFEYRNITLKQDLLETARRERSNVDDSDYNYLRAIDKLLESSGGKIEQHDSEGSGEVIVSLKRTNYSKEQRHVRAAWALFVDDNREVTTFYTRVADALNLKSRAAESVAEAIEILKVEGAPQLVITDLRLKQGSGVELIKHIREEYGDSIPIIVVSGLKEGELPAEIKRSGASTFLCKPVGRRRLFAEIREALSKAG
ncbi:MAG: response regulator [Candidatus Dadabacteria bacterium]|nr:MAG: response regulator [Candidatus Dadabacteria bacterium]